MWGGERGLIVAGIATAVVSFFFAALMYEVLGVSLYFGMIFLCVAISVVYWTLRGYLVRR